MWLGGLGRGWAEIDIAAGGGAMRVSRDLLRPVSEGVTGSPSEKRLVEALSAYAMRLGHPFALGADGFKGKVLEDCCLSPMHEVGHEPEIFTCEHPDGERYICVACRIGANGIATYRAPIGDGVVSAIEAVNGFLRIFEEIRFTGR